MKATAAAGAKADSAKAQRQPMLRAVTGSAAPAANIPRCTPACFTPVIHPLEPAGMFSTIRRLVAELAPAAGMAATPANSSSGHRPPEAAMPSRPAERHASSSTSIRRPPSRSARPPRGRLATVIAKAYPVISPPSSVLVISRSSMMKRDSTPIIVGGDIDSAIPAAKTAPRPIDPARTGEAARRGAVIGTTTSPRRSGRTGTGRKQPPPR